MKVIENLIIDGGHGGHVNIATGDHLRVTNLEGSQVADMWAFVRSNPEELLSTEHTRSTLEKLVPAVGDHLYSNKRRAMFTIIEDTSPGDHDMLMSACDEDRYVLLGHEGYHRSCIENLQDAMEAANCPLPELPSPVNLFERVAISDTGVISIEPPLVKAGQAITLLAEMDMLVVFSACPMDIAMTNGPDKRSKPIQVERLGTGS